MSLSVFLAWLLGPLFVVVGLSMLINRAYYRDMVERFFADPQDYYFSGVAAFLAGVAIVVSHNLWVADWRVVITLLGWIALAKGTARILAPQAGRGLFQAMKPHSYLVLGAVAVVPIGLFLTWNAWRGTV